MNNLCTDIGFKSVNKKGEQLCGDHMEIVEQGENSFVMVLADGLGSGVKACILSTLTSKIISTMMANNLTIEDCVSTIASTLPVCEVRKVAYSTFTIVRVFADNTAETYERAAVVKVAAEVAGRRDIAVVVAIHDDVLVHSAHAADIVGHERFGRAVRDRAAVDAIFERTEVHVCDESRIELLLDVVVDTLHRT